MCLLIQYWSLSVCLFVSLLVVMLCKVYLVFDFFSFPFFVSFDCCFIFFFFQSQSSFSTNANIMMHFSFWIAAHYKAFEAYFFMGVGICSWIFCSEYLSISLLFGCVSASFIFSSPSFSCSLPFVSCLTTISENLKYFYLNFCYVFFCVQL